ncbi:restriction endonuclease subunit S [Bacillus mycoides]|uniref:Type I restriction modification DNA specificity domain-containing protein n=1 Tax=Bacillus cereus MC67 TaxID=1053219 RepID=J8F1X2_BACCE|nr:restriction endonuclease subunit S [Bacillus cereus]EJR03167.1 hypothetical protein II3_01084 [Bacillus cereus MC67]
MSNQKKTPIGLLPNDWQLKKNRELFNNKSVKNFPNEPVLSVTQNKGVIPRNLLEKRVNMENSNTATFKLVEEGDFIISLRSFQGGLEVSKYRGLVSPAYTVIQPKVPIVTDFYRHYFKSNKFINILNKAVVGIRDGKQISFSVFSELVTPYPSLQEQSKIASILSSVDKAIEKTESVIEQTERVKKGLMQHLFTKGIGHTTFKNTKVGRVPEKWAVKNLNDIAKVIDCKHYTPQYCETGIPIIRTNNLTPADLVLDGSYYTSEEDYFKLTDKYAPKKGDIIYGREGSFGVASYVKMDERFSIGQRVVVISPFKVLGRFLHLALNADVVLKQVILASLGTTVKRINVSDIKGLLIPIPTLEEQEEIVNIILPVFQRIENERAYLDSLNKIKKGLMQSLLTGKIRVKVDEAEVTQI